MIDEKNEKKEAQLCTTNKNKKNKAKKKNFSKRMGRKVHRLHRQNGILRRTRQKHYSEENDFCQKVEYLIRIGVQKTNGK